MASYFCAHRARRRNTRLAFETLAKRELLAADLQAPSLDVSATDQPIAIVDSNGDGSSERNRERSIDALTEAIGSALPIISQRSHDGLGNNFNESEWGSVGQELLRAAPADYADGLSEPAGANRPSARAVSNALSTQVEGGGNQRDMSAFVFAWGQFIDHDIDLSPTQLGGETIAIEVPIGDPHFDPEGTGTQVIPLSRSIYNESTGIDTPREQTNAITAWIDGSMVYGSDQETAESLRSFEGGRLLTSEGDLPPLDEHGFFMAGDERANENTGLLAMHTLFIREHNHWAELIGLGNPDLSDEEIYQQARAIVAAEIQAITYNEFLPALLGKKAVDDYTGYDPTVDPSIANEFSTAAFRMHTLINDEIGFVGDDGTEVRDAVSLAESFFNPSLLQEAGIDSVLKSFASSQSQEYDLQVVDSLRNFLFGHPGQGGFDLVSLNIERGREHGLADYASAREAYGLEPVESFADITSNEDVQRELEQVYGTVDNIDLWVGVLAEDHVKGSSVGESAQAIVSDQFERLRDGDRFWYENILRGDALRQVRSTGLADIIVRNTTVENLQDNVFVMDVKISGHVQLDNNRDGGPESRADGLAGITVELLNDSGEVIDSTTTNSDGRFRFASIIETGSYQVRVVLPEDVTAVSATTVDVLVSTGSDRLPELEFAVTPDDDDTSDDGQTDDADVDPFVAAAGETVEGKLG